MPHNLDPLGMIEVHVGHVPEQLGGLAEPPEEENGSGTPRRVQVAAEVAEGKRGRDSAPSATNSNFLPQGLFGSPCHNNKRSAFSFFMLPPLMSTKASVSASASAAIRSCRSPTAENRISSAKALGRAPRPCSLRYQGTTYNAIKT